MFIKPFKRDIIFAAICLGFFCAAVHGQNLDIGGVTLLREATTNLNGTGIRVGQIEAVDGSNNEWEVNPTNVLHSVSLFTYFSNGVSSVKYTNSLGNDSGHADAVGQIFYGILTGGATNVAHVDNVEADYYFNDIIQSLVTLPGGVTDAVVNQSFTFGAQNAATQEQIDSLYDNYSIKFQTLFISAACNFSISATVCAPGTSYNCISVGAYNGDSSVGPTIDNGRCKPDITATTSPYSDETSFSTPLVAGAAAILMQAGSRGDGGGDTNSAANMTTTKALLLNGAVKPADWTNVAPSPLDFRYGAGVVNVFNSYEQLAGGKHDYNFSTNVSVGASHPPVAITASIPVLNGWDYNTNKSSSTNDEVNHYFFNVTNSSSSSVFTLATTLVWNRHLNTNNINNLDLFLYNTAGGSLVASSTSAVDNVQHIFIPKLAQGRYDLQVWKAGGSGIVSTNEPYALAWGIFSESLKITPSPTNLALSWPAYPAGFALVSATSLSPPVTWSTNNLPGPVFTNNQNVISLSATNSEQFFRLQTPDF